MRYKLTIVLIILNVLAGYYIYNLEQQSGLADEFNKESKKVFHQVYDIDHLTIATNTPQEQTEYQLNRKRSRWHINQPINWPANNNAVERIIEQLQSLEKEISFTMEDIAKRDQTLADYGLDNPSLRLTFSSPSSEPQILNIGAPTEMGSRIYVMHPNGEEIIVIGDTLLRSLSLSLNELRSQHIFDIPLFEINSLVLQSDEQRTRIEKEQDQWNFVTPVSAAANSKLVDNTLTALLNTRAELLLSVAENDPERLGLANPSMRFVLGGTNRRQTLLLGDLVVSDDSAQATQPMRYALLEDNPTVFTVLAEPLEKLKQAPAFLREKRFFQFDTERVSDIIIAQPPREVRLQKLEQQNGLSAAGAWQVMTTNDDGNIISQPADPEIVARLLDRLSKLEAKQFVSDAPAPGDLFDYGFEDPNGAISIQLEDGQTLTLLLGHTPTPENSNAPRHAIFAKRQDAPSIYQVQSSILALANTDPLHYRKRILEAHPNSAQIEALTLTELASNTTLFAKRINIKSETWPIALQGMESKTLEAMLVLVQQFRTEFAVNTYINDTFAELPNLPWAYKLEVEISLPGGQDNQTLRRTYFFTQRLAGNRQIGGCLELGFVFTLRQELIDALFPLTFNKTLAPLPETPEEVDQTEL